MARQSYDFPFDGGPWRRCCADRSPRETAAGERRVALVPESCKKLIQAGYEVAIESGAGEAAGFANSAYTDAGAAIVADPASLVASGDIVLKVTAPGNNGGRDETAWMKPGAIYVGSLMPLRNLGAVRALAAKHVTAFATDAIPRTHARAVDGHAVVDGEPRGLQGRAARRRGA